MLFCRYSVLLKEMTFLREGIMSGEFYSLVTQSPMNWECPVTPIECNHGCRIFLEPFRRGLMDGTI